MLREFNLIARSTIVDVDDVDCAYSSGSSIAAGSPRKDEAYDVLDSAWGEAMGTEVRRT